MRVQNDTIVQLGVAMSFTMFFMLIASIAAPFRKQENDYFAVTCNFSLTAVFLFCTMLKVKTIAETLDPGELYDRFFFDDFIMGGCLFVCVFGALALACALSVQTIIEAARVPTFRLLSTGNRPELALAKGHTWHMFLSHIWGTGQDQCAVLKRQLCLLLTGVSVFLDVDDLEDIGALEEYIEKSAVIMIFISKGYFKSVNCLREVRCTVTKNKPISLMHDPVRGGAPLQTIIDDECPAEKRGHIFGAENEAARPVIIFHRIEEFQVVTMKLLAQDVLLSCPNFQIQQSSSANLTSKKPSVKVKANVQLILPGEVARKKLRFHRPITVYVSLNNPGAAAAMEALQDGFSIRRSSRASSQYPSQDSSQDSSQGFSPVRRHRLLAAAASRSRGPIRSTVAPPEDVTLKRKNKEQPTAANNQKGKASHMLLYLNDVTFIGEEGKLFAEEVRCAFANGFPMVMMHENDVPAGGCEFSRFFVTTPQDLISSGLYTALACSWYPDPFRQVSVALVALAFGAEEPQSCSVLHQVKRLGRRAASPAMELTESLSMSIRAVTTGGKFRRHITDSSVEVSAPSTTIAPAVEPLDPEAQAGESVADSTTSIAGTLYMRLPETGVYEKVKVEVFGKAEGAMLCYEDLKGGSSTELRGSSVYKVEAVNPKMLEFALLTNKSSPERGRLYSFRVSTHADFARWMSGLELWIELTRKSSDLEVAAQTEPSNETTPPVQN